MRILLIDDEDIVLHELTETLLVLGHSVISVSDGEAAWETFSQAPNQIDFILTDIKMPGLNGLELLSLLHENDHDLPIVLMTEHGDLELSVQALKLGASDYLLKPFGVEQLEEVLNKIEALRVSKEELLKIVPSVQCECTLGIDSDTQLIAPVVTFFENLCRPICCLFRVSSKKIGICLQEAISNAIIHGHFGIESGLKEESWEDFQQLIEAKELQTEFKSKQVQIKYSLLFPTYPAICIEVIDMGNGFDRDKLPDFKDSTALLSSGRGLLIIHSFMDEISWNKVGNSIKMVKFLRP